MWKKASADLSKYFIIFFIFFSFNRVESQSLNYNLDWGSENFITDAKIIFSNLTLQSSQQLLSGRGYEGNIMLSGGTSISLTENLPIMPLFSSFYHVSFSAQPYLRNKPLYYFNGRLLLVKNGKNLETKLYS